MRSPTAARMRWRVRFDFRLPQTGPGGGTLGPWSDETNGSITRWAEIRELTGKEEVMGQRLTGIQPRLIIVRYDSQTKTIDSSWRAVELLNGVAVGTSALKTAADMERRRRWWTMLAVQGDLDD
jgi:hypothetical protein